mgnify:CR=1 FL=1
MDNQEYNIIDNYAFYLFFFLSFLSIGNDFYFVLHEMSNHNFVKKRITYLNDFKNIIMNILSNKAKKVKNGYVINENKQNYKLLKNNNKNEAKNEAKNELKNKEIKIEKVNLDNKIIQEFNDKNDEYIDNLNKLKVNYNNNIKKNIKKKSI